MMRKFFSIQICKIVINSCTAEPRYWQNHVNYIFAINALLLLCKEPSATTLVFDVKCPISPLRSALYFFIILCCIYGIR